MREERNGPTTIRSYDSFEEMQADQERAHREAVANMTASQRALGAGDYVMALNPPDVGPSFGAIQSVPECRAWNELYCGVGDVEENLRILAERSLFKPPSTLGKAEDKLWEEDGFASAVDFVDYYIAQHMESISQGYLHGWWFSTWCPEGELDSGHASICVGITEAVYLDAFAHGGDQNAMSALSRFQMARAIWALRAEYMTQEGQKKEEGSDNGEGNRSHHEPGQPG